jgi:hypothetical protein
MCRHYEENIAGTRTSVEHWLMATAVNNLGIVAFH